jgi:hypothetical protein
LSPLVIEAKLPLGVEAVKRQPAGVDTRTVPVTAAGPTIAEIADKV